MEVKIGDIFNGKDCHGEEISGTICTLNVNTVVVEVETNRYIVTKYELFEAGLTIPEIKKNIFR